MTIEAKPSPATKIFFSFLLMVFVGVALFYLKNKIVENIQYSYFFYVFKNIARDFQVAYNIPSCLSLMKTQETGLWEIINYITIITLTLLAILINRIFVEKIDEDFINYNLPIINHVKFKSFIIAISLCIAIILLAVLLFGDLSKVNSLKLIYIRQSNHISILSKAFEFIVLAILPCGFYAILVKRIFAYFGDIYGSVITLILSICIIQFDGFWFYREGYSTFQQFALGGLLSIWLVTKKTSAIFWFLIGIALSALLYSPEIRPVLSSFPGGIIGINEFHCEDAWQESLFKLVNINNEESSKYYYWLNFQSWGRILFWIYFLFPPIILYNKYRKKTLAPPIWKTSFK